MSHERRHNHHRHHAQEACGCEETARGHGRRHHASGCACGCDSANHPEAGCTCGCHDRGAHGGGYHTQRCTCGCHDDELECSCGSYDEPCGEDCTCACHNVGFRRRFISRAERIAWLEEYLEALEAEAQGVRERLEELAAEDAGSESE